MLGRPVINYPHAIAMVLQLTMRLAPDRVPIQPTHERLDGSNKAKRERCRTVRTVRIEIEVK